MKTYYHICNIGFKGAGGLKKSIPTLSKYINRISNCNSVTISNIRALTLVNYSHQNRFFLHSSYQLCHIICVLFFSHRNNVFLVPRGAFNRNLHSFKKMIFLKILLLIIKMKRCSVKCIYLNINEQKNSVLSLEYEIIPNGIEQKVVGLDNHVIRNRFNAKIILFMSRFDIFQKGLDRIKIALEKCSKEIEFKFFLVGAKNNDELVNTQKLFSNIDNIVIKGYTDKVELSQLIKNSMFHVLPSRCEGLPLSCLETLANGIPQIITAETNILDIVLESNCGFEFSEKTLNSLKFLSIDEYSRLSHNSHSLAAKFNWDDIAIKYSQL